MQMTTTGIRIIAVIGFLILLGGCGGNAVKPPENSLVDSYPSEEMRASLGTIAVVPVYGPPKMSLNDSVYDKSACAREAAADAALGTLNACSGGYECIGAVLLSPFAAAIGAVAGAAEADTEEEVRARIETINSRTATSQISRRFRERGTQIAAAYDEFTFGQGRTDQDAQTTGIPFETLRNQQIDTVIQLGITDIESIVAEDVYCDPALALDIQTDLVMFSATGQQIYSTSLSRRSSAKKLEDWARKDAKYWDDALHEFVDEVTVSLFDDVFVHVAPPTEPRQVHTSSFMDNSYEFLLEKKPTLAWDWLTSSDTRDSDPIPDNAYITYDLRVIDDMYERIHYEAYGLDRPQHRVGKKLRKRNYRWQVRANITWDGRQRRTKWHGNFHMTTRRPK